MTTNLATTETTTVYKDSSVLIQTWLDSIDVRANSRASYKRSVEQFLQYLKENNIAEPTATDIADWRDSLLEDHKASTVQNYLTSVKLLYKFLEENELCKDITKKVKNVVVDKAHKKDALTPQQASLLLHSTDTTTLKGLRDRAVLALMLTAGLRDIEISRANVCDITIIQGNTCLLLQGKGRDDKNEYCKLQKHTAKYIFEYLQARRVTDTAEPLFVSTSNNNRSSRLSTKTVSTIAKEALRSIGLDSERLTAHSLRHTFATISISQGTDIREIQQALRHRNLNTTLIYLEDISRANNTCSEAVEQAIFND